MIDSDNPESGYKNSDAFVDKIDDKIKNNCINYNFGACNDCSSLQYVLFEYGRYWAQCGYTMTSLSHADKIVHCTMYNQRGGMALIEMYRLALDINVKESIGFCTGKDDERTDKDNSQ